MKTGFALIWLFASSVLCVANTNYLDPTTVFKSDGVLAITDGSSYYVFRTNGTFISVPRGMSGRTFEGTCTWSFGPGVISITAQATEGWWNGPASGDNYRIIFVIHAGGTKRPERVHIPRTPPITEIFDSYFFIEELVKIPKPKK